MCNPALILLGVGAGLNFAGEMRAKHAQENAYAVEQGRQREFTNRQQAATDDSLAKTGQIADPTAEAAAADARKAAFVAALNKRPEGQHALPGSYSAPAVVGEANNRVVNAERADTDQHAGALASLAGFGDQLFRNNINLNRNGQTIGQVSRDKANSARVLDAELRAAADKGGTLRGLGQLAMMASSFVGGGVGGGGGAPASAGNVGSFIPTGMGGGAGPFGMQWIGR